MNDKLNVMRRVNYILDSTEKENNNGNKIGVFEKELKEKNMRGCNFACQIITVTGKPV